MKIQVPDAQLTERLRKLRCSPQMLSDDTLGFRSCGSQWSVVTFQRFCLVTTKVMCQPLSGAVIHVFHLSGSGPGRYAQEFPWEGRSNINYPLLYQSTGSKMDVILYICNPCIQEAEEGQPWWRSQKTTNKQSKLMRAIIFLSPAFQALSRDAEVSGYASDERELMGENT